MRRPTPRPRRTVMLAAAMALVAGACCGGSGGMQPPSRVPSEGPITTPECRLAPVDEQRLRDVIARAADRLAGCRGLDTKFAAHVDINPAPGAPVSAGGLVVEVVRDATPNQVHDRCIDEPIAAALHHAKDDISVNGICQVERARPPSAARIRCSAGALEILLENSSPALWDIPLLYVFAHELSHVARGHTKGAFLPAPAAISLQSSPRDRAGSVVGYCNDFVARDPKSRQQQEIQADEDALRVLRIELDDVDAAGPGCHVPPERGGLGQIPQPDLTGAPDERPLVRTPRGRLGSAEKLVAQFRTLAEKLGAWDAQFTPESMISERISNPPVMAPNRLAFDKAAGELLCEALNAPVSPRKFLLPTLPTVSHPDGYLRLSRISRAIDGIANDKEAMSAVIDREVAAYSTGLVGPFCRKAKDAQAALPVDRGARASCEALLAPPPAEQICATFSAELHDMPFMSAPRTMKAQASTKGAASVVEVDVPVTAAASLGRGGMLVGMGFFDDTAIGLLTPETAEATLTQIPCTPTSIAVHEGRGIVFCHEPLAIVPLTKDGKPERVQRLRRVMLDGSQVDGLIPGLLDRNGQPEDQSMYERPLVHGQIDRYGVALMKQARFRWANVVDGHVLAALDFPGGGGATVEHHAAMGVTVEYASGRVAPLPLWRTTPYCTDITDSLVVGSVNARWFGVLPLSPVEVVEMPAGGAVLKRHYKPRELPSGELAELDVPLCATSPVHGTFVCVDESGAVFEAFSGERVALGSFPKDSSEIALAMCGTANWLHLLARKRELNSGEFTLYSLGRGIQRGTRVHHEEYRYTAGLSCNAGGTVAYFASDASAALVHVPE